MEKVFASDSKLLPRDFYKALPFWAAAPIGDEVLLNGKIFCLLKPLPYRHSWLGPKASQTSLRASQLCLLPRGQSTRSEGKPARTGVQLARPEGQPARPKGQSAWRHANERDWVFRYLRVCVGMCIMFVHASLLFDNI